jgi:CO/xanthine dehydrogenase Mo-binding subunit
VQRVASAALGIGVDAVRVVRRSTGEGPRDPGAGGSRTVHILGNATLDAIQKLRDALAAAGWNGASETVASALDALARSSAEPPAFTGSYDSNAAHVEANNYAAYCVDVAVDGQTGVVDIERVTFVADTGTMLNPTAYRGQIDGGFMFGIGTATTEELLVEDGRIVNLSLADYKLPCMRDIPPFDVVLMDDEAGPGPFGAKAAGELNTGGVGPAVANAVADACGIRVPMLPVTAERVLAQLAQE